MRASTPMEICAAQAPRASGRPGAKAGGRSVVFTLSDPRQRVVALRVMLTPPPTTAHLYLSSPAPPALPALPAPAASGGFGGVEPAAEAVVQLLDVVTQYDVGNALGHLERVIAQLRAETERAASARRVLRTTPVEVLRTALRLRAARSETIR